MKIIPLYSDERSLIRKAIMANKSAQRRLYEKYAPKMLAICKRYVKDAQYAEDVMIQGFLKAFMRLNTYKGQGSFEAWIRQIMVHEALNFLRKNKSLEFETTIPDKENYKKSGVSIQTDTGYLLKLINDLPFSYRFVFMLHAIEGYKHTEIAKLLRISENTSKSKLSKARKILRQKLELQRKRYEAL